MLSKPVLGGLGLLAMLVAGCDTTPKQGPLSSMPTGTTESLLRQQQLQNVQSDPNRAMQNPVATGANPGVGGIERAATGGSGSAAGVVAGQRTDGTIARPGTGAPTSR